MLIAVPSENDELNDYREVLSKASFKEARAALGTSGSIIRYFKSLQLNCNQYAYIINIATQEISVAKGFDVCLGLKNEEITIENIHSIIHPEDQVKMKQVVVDAYEYGMSLKNVKPFELQFSTDYRVVKKDGTIIRVNRHPTISEVDEEGKMVSTLSICSDISHIKRGDNITAKMFGPYDVSRFNKKYNSEPRSAARKKKSLLSKREKEILILIGNGYSNNEIAKKLSLSPKTTETHRKNMQRKLGINTTAKLILFANKNEIF
jgi:DNA-binding CsgD family transcriptional regulator